MDGLINMSKNLSQNNSILNEKNIETDLVKKILNENDKEDLYVIGKKCEERSKVTQGKTNIENLIPKNKQKFNIDQDFESDDENVPEFEEEENDDEENEEDEENDNSMLDLDELKEINIENQDEIEQRINENIREISDKFINDENKGKQKDFLLKTVILT